MDVWVFQLTVLKHTVLIGDLLRPGSAVSWQYVHVGIVVNHVHVTASAVHTGYGGGVSSQSGAWFLYSHMDLT